MPLVTLCKQQGDKTSDADEHLANHANSANFANSGILIAIRGIASAKFELEFVDFQGLDAGLESRGSNSELRCRS